MADQWYYSKQGQRIGPVSEEQINQLVSSGQIQPTDLAWKQGMGQWTKVSQLFPPPTDPDAPPPTVSSHQQVDIEQRTRNVDEKFCESCGKVINIAAEICPKCGVRQKSASGIKAFFGKCIKSVKDKVDYAKQAIKEEQEMVTGISPMHKTIAIIAALGAGWTGVTGLGSIIAGRKKAGFAMLGIPLFLGILSILCLMGWFVSAVASIFVVGIPFFLFFSTVLVPLLPLFAATFWGFYVADVLICIKAK